MNQIYKILIATSPFAKCGKKPLELLKQTGYELVFNTVDRRLTDDEVEKLISDVDAVIAGTENYTIEALRKAPKLKVIARVGIGLDNVSLKDCKALGISVTYTPDAPSKAVAELTVANIINLARYICQSDRSIRHNTWNRYMGYLLKELNIGIIGVGRIGKIVVKLLQPFEPKILACDLAPDKEFSKQYNISWYNKEDVFRNADIISLHIPYNKANHHFINYESIEKMKIGSFLINTSRGNVVNENALVDALKQKHLTGAAIDVFSHEPYEGPLSKLESVILTAHIGAYTNESRYTMELEAVEDCIRVLKGKKPVHDAIAENLIEN